MKQTVFVEYFPPEADQPAVFALTCDCGDYIDVPIGASWSEANARANEMARAHEATGEAFKTESEGMT